MSEPRAGRLTKCPFCSSPSKSDGSIQHSAGCEGLEDAGYSKLQIHVLENTLVAAIDLATQPPRDVTLDVVNHYAWTLGVVPSGESVPVQMISTMRRQLEAARSALTKGVGDA